MALIEATNQQRVEIFKEVNETTDTKLEINKELIKQWLDIQPHLPHNYDERILASYIRGCKHDLERVKRKLDNYFTSRSLMPDYFSNRDPFLPELRKTTEGLNIIPLPRLRPDGCRVTYHRVRDMDPSVMDPKNICKIMMMIGDIRIVEEGPIAGDVFVFDLLHFKSSHLPKIMNPSVKKAIIYCQSLPQRLKEIHMINSPSYIDAGIKFIKMFVNEKIRDRFHTHSGGSESIYKYVPQEFFPSDFGGKEKSINELQEDWWKKLDNYSSYFEKQESVHSDESKRVLGNGVSSTEYDDLYGTSGSFQKLNID